LADASFYGLDLKSNGKREESTLDSLAVTAGGCGINGRRPDRPDNLATWDAFGVHSHDDDAAVLSIRKAANRFR
jgi:hypothetical protein